MNQFTLLFLAFICISVIVQFWLSRRQFIQVARHRNKVPNAFDGKISLSAHQKAADYTIAHIHFGYFEALLGVVILLLWTVGGALEFLDQYWRATALSGHWTGVGVIMSLVFISALLNIPSEAYATFVIEQKFGFNKSSVSLFIRDTIKQALLLLLIGTPLVWVILWLMDNTGDRWWFYVWLVWMSFTLFLQWAYPTLIAPIFNQFTPLDNTGLVTRIEHLLKRCGFSNNGIFVMDGSRRSAHGNAYFTGYGKHKRIVFFDTLIKTLGDREIEAVLAHELGHFKHRHVIKHMITLSIISLFYLALLGWLIQQSWFYSGLGVEHASNYIALILFVLVLPSFSFFLQPINAFFMRKHEFQADTFAANNSDASELINALVKMYSENASTLTPDPLYSAFHDSHPPAPIRIAFLQSLAAKS